MRLKWNLPLSSELLSIPAATEQNVQDIDQILNRLLLADFSALACLSNLLRVWPNSWDPNWPWIMHNITVLRDNPAYKARDIHEKIVLHHKNFCLRKWQVGLSLALAREGVCPIPLQGTESFKYRLNLIR